MIPMFNLDGRVAIVTGGNGGIGLGMAEGLAQAGAKIVVVGRNSEKNAAAVSRLEKLGVEVFSIEKDLTEATAGAEIASATEERFGRIDILINNAGITGPTAPLWEYDLEKWKKVVDINLMGTFNCCRAIVPNMIKNDYGRIVNVASVAGKDGNANASAYSAGKAGAIGLTKSLGKELADKNIAVNAVTPAGAKTRILDQMTKEHVQRMLSKVPRARFLKLNELSSMVCWLSSEENSFSTAAVFDISGGRSTY